MTNAADSRDIVRTALEQVCARGDMALAPSCYAEDFVDHVGRLEYRGLDGVRRSTALYRALFDDLAFEVVDQIAEGDRVATRFLVTGSNRGRRVRLEGITMSRLRDGRIVEDSPPLDLRSEFDGQPRRAPRAEAADHVGRSRDAEGPHGGGGQTRLISLVA
jgi:ketosteroid isomerase-like protein